MKILITHVYSRKNKGDAAILSALVGELTTLFGKPLITISTMEELSKNSDFDGYPLVSSFFCYGKPPAYRFVFQVARTIFLLLQTTVWLVLRNIPYMTPSKIFSKELASIIQAYETADVIVGVGGGYLRGKQGIEYQLNAVLLCFEFLFGKLLGKPVILYSQSIGPFGDAIQKALYGYTLRRMDFIMAREDITMELLKQLGVSSQKYARTIDGGFLFTGSSETGLAGKRIQTFSPDKKRVGITLRDWLPAKAQANYEHAMAEFIEYITTVKKMTAILIPQVTATDLKDDDREPEKRVYNQLSKTAQKNTLLIEDEIHHSEIKHIYSLLDYLIGTRFHSVIFALTSFIPAIAIEYEYKTRGILKDLDLSSWHLSIEEVQTDKVIALFDKLISERNSYRKHLEKVIPAYIRKARNDKAHINRVIDSQ